jgi:hypothetical protein
MVQATVDRYWLIWFKANDPPNPSDARLDSVLEGNALALTRHAMSDRLAKHEVVRLPPQSIFSHRTETLSIVRPGALADLKECVVDDSQLIDADSGKVVNGSTATFEFDETLERNGRSPWRISLSQTDHEWMGVAGCAA